MAKNFNKYETEAHKRWEQFAANLYQHWQDSMGRGITLLPHKEMHITDYMMENHRHEWIGDLEVRVRDFSWGDFPDVMISARKLNRAQKLTEQNRRFVFLVMCEDRLMSYLFDPTHELKREFGGRNPENMRDENDREWIYKIPNTLFRTIYRGGKNLGPLVTSNNCQVADNLKYLGVDISTLT